MREGRFAMRTNTNSQTILGAAVTLLKFRSQKLVDTFYAVQDGLEISRITSTRIEIMHKKLIDSLRNPAAAFSSFCFLSPRSRQTDKLSPLRKRNVACLSRSEAKSRLRKDNVQMESRSASPCAFGALRPRVYSLTG